MQILHGAVQMIFTIGVTLAVSLIALKNDSFLYDWRPDHDFSATQPDGSKLVKGT
jgi:hypothetical protein